MIDPAPRGDECFELTKALVGTRAGRACISPFGELRVEHPLLRAPLVFSISRLAGALELGEESVLPAFEREPIGVHLPSDGFRGPNVALVMRQPLRVGPFKYGAQQQIPLTRRDRKQGVDVDLLTLSVADPGLLLAALRAKGVQTSRSLDDALGSSIPLAPPELAVEVLAARRRGVRTMARRQIGLGVITAILVALRATVETRPWETSGRVSAAALAAAWLVGLVIAARQKRSSRGGLRRWAWILPLVLVAAVVALALLGSQHRLTGGPYLLAMAVLAALVSGPLIGFGLRSLRATRAAPDPSPLADPPKPRWALAAASAAAAIGVIVVAAQLEDAAASIDRAAQSALVDADDLPVGWESCCNGDHFLRGDSLDEHICGGDDSALPAHVAAVARTFTKPIPRDSDFLDGQVEMTVLIAPTPEDASAEFRATDGQPYVECTSDSVGRLARESQSRATGDSEVVYGGRLPVQGVTDGVLEVFRVRVPIGDKFDVSWTYFLRLRIGRAIVRLPIQHFAIEQMDADELGSIVQAVVKSVEESSAP